MNMIDLVEARDDQQLTATRPPRQPGFGRHLLSGAGININELLATPVDDVFSEYLHVVNDEALRRFAPNVLRT